MVKVGTSAQEQMSQFLSSSSNSLDSCSKIPAIIIIDYCQSKLLLVEIALPLKPNSSKAFHDWLIQLIVALDYMGS
ncbi:MAG: hypothetical protein XD94_1785, partial [Mesotoga prima]